MSNERLRHALQSAGLQPDDLAERLDVDVKTIGRWLSGRTPTSRHRARTVEILGQRIEITEHELWPDVAASPARDDTRELVAIYADSDDIRLPDWRAMLRSARVRIDLLGATLLEIIGTAGITDLIADRARAGVRVRILTAHPESLGLALLAEQLDESERDHAGHTALDRDLAQAHNHLDRIAGEANVQLLRHWSPPGPSVWRFDDEMLIELPLIGDGGPPLLHLRRREEGRLFDRFQAHVDTISQGADTEPPLPLDG